MAGVVFRSMCPDDEDQVRELYYSFWREEPMAAGLKMDVPRECLRYVDYALAESLHNDVSVVALDKTTNRIVGFRACAIATLKNPQHWIYPENDPDCKTMIKEYELLDQLYSGLDIFSDYKVDTVVMYKGLHVHKEYTNRGIATKMIERSLEICKDHGLKLAVVEATHVFSRRIFDKLDFDMVREIKYADYIADGTLDMPTDSRHKSVTLHIKRI